MINQGTVYTKIVHFFILLLAVKLYWTSAIFLKHTMPAESITIIFSPYHVGLRDHRVGDGPNRMRDLSLVEKLKALEITIHFEEIPPVDDFEGEIGRSFEVLRRISDAVSRVKKANSFPLVLSGNCMATVAVACGLGIEDPGFVYFDAHDDMDTPSTNTNGYFDAMGLSMLAGKSWHAMTQSIPGYSPKEYRKFLYCGLRDIDESQKQTVLAAGADVIWGNAKENMNFSEELERQLRQRDYSPALVHLDLDVLDESVGKVNGYESAGGIQEEDAVRCMGIVPQRAKPVSLTVCSFNPNLGDGNKIAAIAIRAVTAFVTSMIESGKLLR